MIINTKEQPFIFRREEKVSEIPPFLVVRATQTLYSIGYLNTYDVDILMKAIEYVLRKPLTYVIINEKYNG